MTYDARNIANWFVDRKLRDGGSLSVMSLLKLTYIAHGWFLEMRNRPLFSNKIQAWQYGPVIPEVYDSFRSQGVNISQPSSFNGAPISAVDQDFLEQIYNIYGNMSAFRLSELTHEEGGPWQVSSMLGGSYANIPDDLIKSHYGMKRMKDNQDAHGN